MIKSWWNNQCVIVQAVVGTIAASLCSCFLLAALGLTIYGLSMLSQ